VVAVTVDPRGRNELGEGVEELEGRGQQLPGSLVRRGRRRRRVRSILGGLEFGLRQVTCRDCCRTWCPFAERLGLRPRQRVLDELLRRLVDWVTELSYEKTTPGRTRVAGCDRLGADPACGGPASG
jgi:hypothetical protein